MFGMQKFPSTTLAMILLLVFLPGCTWSTAIGCDAAALVTAITSANANAAPSTINLATGCIYMLTAAHTTITSPFGGSTFEYGDVGLPPIITPITINGYNATIVRADAAPDFRIFFVSGNGSLTLNDVTLTNGFADASIGGGVESAFPGSGGAVYNDGAFLELNRSTLQGNTADFHGGAIFNINHATTYVNNSTISDNSAPLGGGIYVYHGGLLSIENSTIKNNSASTEGGGINLGHGAELNVKNSVIESNHSGRRGGGIFKDGGADRLPTIINGTTFRDNTADWGGGAIFIWRTPLTIADSVFLQNQAGEYGGGLGYQNDSTETVQIRNTTFESNTAALDGGGIHFSGELMAISGSTFRNNEAENGGAIHNAAAELSHYIIRDTPTMTIHQSTLQDNSARAYGGGIYNSGLLTVNGSRVSGNQSVPRGGGIFNRGKITVQDSTFSGNVTGLDGGGLHNSSSGSARVIGSTFVGNTSGRGGGLASIGGEAEIVNSTFSANNATEMGGGIFNMGPAPSDASLGGGMDASHITFAHNKAPQGGGIATSGGQLKIKNSIVAYSASGGDCYNAGAAGGFVGVGENLDSDDSCAGFTLTSDPLLEPLADNGGPTQTHGLKVDSPAIDAAPDCTTIGGAAVSVDQRGVTRPDGPFCDLGAYEFDQEFQAPAPGAMQGITPTPEEGQVTALKNANCRYGPGTAYDIRDTLYEGQTARVIGRNEANTWWQVELPESGKDCWVSSVTVATSGDLGGVQVVEVAPAPEAPPTEPPAAPQPPVQGCYVHDKAKGVNVCTVPCPPNANPGGACTP